MIFSLEHCKIKKHLRDFNSKGLWQFETSTLLGVGMNPDLGVKSPQYF